MEVEEEDGMGASGSGGAAPLNKRKAPHITRACAACRNRRVKCSGDRPACKRCVDKGIVPCEYRDHEEDKRKPYTKAFVGALQTRIEVLERELETLRLGTAAGGSAGGSGSARHPTTGENSRTTSRSNRSSDQDGAPRAAGRLHYSALSDNLRYEDANSSFTGAMGEHVAQAQQNNGFPDISHLDFSYLAATLTPKLHSEILDAAFTCFYSAHRVVDQPSFQAGMYAGTRSHAYSTFYHLAILAVGCRYLLEPPVALLKDPEDPNTRGVPFMERARGLVEQELDSPKLSTIRGLLILAQFLVGMGNIGTARVYARMAMQITQDWGLNYDTSAAQLVTPIPPELCALRTDVFWAAFTDDVAWACLTGGKPTFLPAEVQQPYPLVIIADEHNMASGDTIWHWGARLQTISCRILATLYSPGAEMPTATAVSDLQILLNAWYRDLPTMLKTATNIHYARLQSVFELNFNFHLLSILINRPFCKDNGEAALDCPLRPAAIRECHEAARQMLRILKHFREYVGMEYAPLNIIHNIFCCGSFTLAAGQETGSLPQSTVTDVEVCIQSLHEMARVWPCAALSGRALSSLLRQRSERATMSQLPPPAPPSTESTPSMHSTPSFHPPPYSGPSDSGHPPQHRQLHQHPMPMQGQMQPPAFAPPFRPPPPPPHQEMARPQQGQPAPSWDLLAPQPQPGGGYPGNFDELLGWSAHDWNSQLLSSAPPPFQGPRANQPHAPQPKGSAPQWLPPPPPPAGGYYPQLH